MIFAATCLHCDAPAKAHLCNTCNRHLILLNPPARAALPHYGPTEAILYTFRSTYSPYLAKGLAAYLALQLKRLHYPQPDCIIPTPSPLFRRLKRGYQPTLLLARHLSKLIDVPVHTPLRRRAGDFPQTSLALDERRRLTPTTFFLKRPKIHKKTVLLIDDLITTGRTRRACQQVLAQGGPKEILFLSLCDDEF